MPARGTITRHELLRTAIRRCDNYGRRRRLRSARSGHVITGSPSSPATGWPTCRPVQPRMTKISASPSATVPGSSCPRRPMVSWPVFEVLIGDAYRLEQAGAEFDRPTHIIDVGAHVGAASLALSRIWPGVPITCVEPSQASASLLRRNLAANRIPATVVQAAAGAQAGTAVLQEAESGSSQNSIDWQADKGDVSDSKWLVPVVPMADLLAQAGTGPVMVKLDCEGSEFEIVGGTPAAAWDQVAVVLMEHHPVPDHDFTELAKRFRQLDSASPGTTPTTGQGWGRHASYARPRPRREAWGFTSAGIGAGLELNPYPPLWTPGHDGYTDPFDDPPPLLGCPGRSAIVKPGPLRDPPSTGLFACLAIIDHPLDDGR